MDVEGRVRVAELVAALSLGIDLGFGQPMEHVLRQCLIALRLAERAGLDEESRGAVYYTALLVNVGCHTDAHEQAKWFGDDIAMKSRKYDYDMRSVRGAAAAMRFLGAGHPPLHRFRLGVEFAISGHREVDGMIDHHAKMTRLLAEQLGLADAVLDGVGAAYERWDGRGWPGSVGGEDIPVPSRIAQLAEFVEVAHRVGGVGAAVALARERSGKQFDPTLAALLRKEAGEILAGVAAVQTWDAVIAAEAVLSAAGHRVRRRASGVAGLTAREVEVLRLAARGLPSREIAQRLVMSPKTVGNHIEHIYIKIGAGSRAAASLFAVQHGLLPEEELIAGGT